LKSPHFVAITLLALVASVSHAQVNIAASWVRATVPGQKATGAFMQLTATTPTKLIDVSTSVAAVAELHEMTMDNNIMRMRRVNSIDLPASALVELKPGSYHIMLMDLKAPVVEGQKVLLTLVFEGADKRRQSIEIEAPVRPLTNARSAP
jgi:hypothetical protein